MFSSAGDDSHGIDDADRLNGQMTFSDAALVLFAGIASLCAILFALAA